MVLFVALARLLSSVDFASWRQLFVVHQIALALAFSALPTSLLSFCGRADARGRRRLIRQHLLLALVLGVVVVVVVVGAANVLATLLGAPDLAPLLRRFAPLTAAAMCSALVTPSCVVLQRTWTASAFSAGLAITTTVPVLVAALQGRPIEVLVTTAVVAAVLVALLAMVLMWRATASAPDDDVNDREVIAETTPDLRRITAFAWPLLLASGLSLLGLRLDHVIVSQRLGPEAYALYAVGAFEVPLFGLVQSSVSSVLLPQVAALVEARRWPELLRVWRSALVRSAIIILPVAAVLLVLADDVMLIVFGERYAAAAPIFRVYLLLAPLRIVTFGLILRAAGRTRPDVVVAVVYLAVVAALAWLLTPALGGVGAMLAVVIGTFGNSLLLVVITTRATGGTLRAVDLYPPPTLLAFASVVVVYHLLLVELGAMVGAGPTMRLLAGGLLVGATMLAGLRIWQRRAQRLERE
jgi:O-antigen/teichoic acid export membrane protein